jgi:nicotinamidase-related amidase
MFENKTPLIVEASREPLDLQLAKTALIVAELQKGVVSIETAPWAAKEVVGNSARLADAIRGGGGLVVLVRVAFSSEGKDMLKPLLDPGAPGWSGNRTPDWAEIVPELAGHPEDHIITKKQWGAFYGTDLDLQLRRRGISTLLMSGIATCIGVESTARDAYERGYQQVFVEDAMTSRSAEEHQHTVTRIFPRIGRVRSTEQVLVALKAR